ncbi:MULTISPECIES: hypothetical protein [unclassified Candidatus Cardinium]|uniref:hypothetical protein n=1 Tax=unclassified Candidatus Cardinium TaxID=2641185 RepID=UPI001FB3386D|nr:MULTISPECIES: hypothetical protein [unclassified Candidatus Cardinium]
MPNILSRGFVLSAILYFLIGPMGCWSWCKKQTNNSKSIITTSKKPTEPIIPYSSSKESIEATKEDNNTRENQKDIIENNSEKGNHKMEENQKEEKIEIENILHTVEIMLDQIEKTNNNIPKDLPKSTTSSGQDYRQEQKQEQEQEQKHNQDNKVKSTLLIQLLQKLKLRPQITPIFRKQINKFKTNIKSLIRPIHELEKELEELTTKQNICQELLKVRMRENSNQGFSNSEGLDERDKALLRKYKYKYKHDKAIHESIEKREFRIAILEAVIQKKKEKIKKQIDKLTKEINESEDFHKELDATRLAKMKENIFLEGLEEEEKKLLNKYKNRTSEQIESMMRDQKSLIRKKTEAKKKLEKQLNVTA